MSIPSNRKIDLAKDGTSIVCDECGNRTFSNVFYLFKVSKFLTGEPQDTVAPVPTFACTKCGNVNKDMRFPKEEDNSGSSLSA
jgi:predicted RNA-binding Zn-ribbon protein involved in translation (DUF1610 family)